MERRKSEKLNKEDEKKIWKGKTAPLWAEREEDREDCRKKWLELARHEDPDFPAEVVEKRMEALQALYDIVSVDENREKVWGDQVVREAVLDCADAGRDDLVRCMAIACLVKLSLSRANTKAMLQDEQALKVLCFNGGRDNPDEVRERAYLALANLSLQLKGTEDTEQAIGLLSVLILGADRRQAVGVRSRIFGVLWSMAAIAANLRAMWKNIDLRYALVAASSAEEAAESVRSCALAVLWTLAGDETNAVEMWQDEGTRAVLLAAISHDQPNTVRVNGLNALRSLGMATALQETLWNNEDAQHSLLQAVSFGQPADVRACALHALISLSANYRNARKMVEADIRNILYQAAEDEQLETGDRRSCRFAAERLEGAEHYEFDEPEAQEHEVEGDAVVDGGDSTAAVEPAAEDVVGDAAEALPSTAQPVPEGAGRLQSGVLERASTSQLG